MSDPALDSDARFVALAARQARFFPAYREAAVRYMSLLAAVSAAVLLIACFNLMNLLLGLAAAREREIATRLALGAGRGRMVRQAATEAFVLTLSAIALSLPAGLWITDWLGAFGRISIVSLNLNLAPDLRALAWSAGGALAIGMTIGGLTALRAGRLDLASGLRGASARPAFPRLAGIGLRDLFVGSQVACAMVVLIAAVTLAGSLVQWRRQRLGFDPGSTLLATVDITRSPAELHRLCGELLDALRGGRFESAALVWDPLPGNTRWTRQLNAPGSAALEVEGNVVSDGYFEAARMPMEAGRTFLPSDDATAQPAIILNRSAAGLLWPHQNPLGRSVRISGEPAARQVIGVVADAQYHPLSETPVPYFFLPMAQAVRPEFTIFVRTAGPPAAFAPVLRQTVTRLAPDAPLSDVRSGEEQVDAGTKQIRVAAAGVRRPGAGGHAAGAGGPDSDYRFAGGGAEARHRHPGGGGRAEPARAGGLCGACVRDRRGWGGRRRLRLALDGKAAACVDGRDYGTGGSGLCGGRGAAAGAPDGCMPAARTAGAADRSGVAAARAVAQAAHAIIRDTWR